MNTKKIFKKKVTKNKQETFKTGDGNPDYIKIEDWEKDLLFIIEKQINGLPSEFDSDSVLPQTDGGGMSKYSSDWQTRDSLEMNVVKETENTTDIGNHMNKPEVKSKTQDTWSSWTPKQLKSRKNPLLTRSSLKNGPIKNILNKKVDSVLDSREELVKLQIDCLREQYQIKIKQHKWDLRIMLRNERRHKAEHEKGCSYWKHKLLIASVCVKK